MNIFKKSFIVFVLFLVLIMFFLQNLNSKTSRDPLSKSFYLVFSKAQSAHFKIQNHIAQLVQKYFFLLNLRATNRNLYKKNQELELKNQLLNELQEENKRLKQFLQLPLNKKFNLLTAQIIAGDLLSKNEMFTINKGSLDGIRPFMAVLHPKGFVGHIFQVNTRSSQVISLLSPLSSVLGRNQRSRIQGLVEIGQKGLLMFRYPSKENFPGEFIPDVRVNDKIILSKTDQTPGKFLIGEIDAVDQSQETFKFEAYVKPAVNISSLEEVFIFLDSRPKSL